MAIHTMHQCLPSLTCYKAGATNLHLPPCRSQGGGGGGGIIELNLMSLQQEESHEYEDIEKYKATPTTTPSAGPAVLTQQSSTAPVSDDINLTSCPAYVSTTTKGQSSGGVEEEEQQYEEVVVS